MKIAKKTLSVFLSLLMMFGTCSVCLSGFSVTAAAATSVTDLKALVSANAGDIVSKSSSGNAYNYTGDNGAVLKTADAVYDYAVNTVRTTGSGGNYNSSDTLSTRVNQISGYTSGNNFNAIKRFIYPDGTTVYGNTAKQSKTGSWEDQSSMSNGTNLNSNSNVSFNSNVTNSVTKTSSVTVDVNKYLLTFGSIAAIPSSFPTKVTYSYVHTYTTSATQMSQTDRPTGGCNSKTYYTHNWTSYKWNYISSATRTVNTTNTTAKSTLQSYANYFTAARLATTKASLLTQSAADLQALYNEANGKYSALKSAFSSAVIDHFFVPADIESYLDTVEFAMQVVLAQPNMATMLGYIAGGYDPLNYSEMSTLYTNATTVYNTIKDYQTDVFDFVVDNYEGFDDFSLAASKTFIDDLFYDMELYQLRALKASIDADIAANEAKLADPLNETDITNIELAALKDKFNGYATAWAGFSTAARNEVFSDGMGYISTFRTAIQTKIDTRAAEVQYENYYAYFIPYIFANVEKWDNTEIADRYTADSAKQTQLNSTYNTYKTAIGTTLVNTVFTFSYEGEDYLLTTAVADYIARLKLNITDRNNAQLDAIKGYAGASNVIDFSNFIGVKTAIDKFDQTLYDYTNGKGWVDSAHRAIYNSISGLLTSYNAFVASGGLDSFVRNHYHDNNGIYTTRYAGEQVVNGDTVGYINDIARDGAGDNYDVTEAKVKDTIVKLDKFITSEDFCSLVSLKDKETGDPYDSLSTAIDAVLTENLFTNEMVNTLVAALFPMLCSTIDGLVGDLGSLGAEGINTSSDPESAGNIDLTALAGDSVKGNLDLYVNGHKGTNTLAQDFESIGVYLYPNSLAKVLPSKYSAIKNSLNSAGTDWSRLVGADGETVLTYDWGVTDYDSFVSTVGSLFSSILPLLQTLLVNGTFSKTLPDQFAYAISDSLSIYADLTLFSTWVTVTDIKAYVSADLSINGSELYLYRDLWIPVMEALGVTDDGYVFKSLSSGASGEQIADAMFEPLLVLIDQLKTQPIEKICEVLPQLMYFLSMDGLQSMINEITLPINVKLKITDFESIKFGVSMAGLANILKGTINDALPAIEPELNLGDMVNLKDMLGFEYTNINSLLSFLFEKLELDLSLPTINAGEIIVCSSYNKNASSQRRDGKRLAFTADKADVFYFLLTYIVDAIGNKQFVENIIEFIQNMNAEEGEEPEPIELPEAVYTIIGNVNSNPDAALAALVELFNPVRYDKTDYTWYESDYNYGSIQGLNDASIVYLNYGNNWTKEKAEYVTNNIDALLESVLEMTGSEETSINAMLQKIISGLFNNKNLTAVVKGLATLGVSIGNDFVYDLVNREFGVELRTWYNAFGYLFPEIAAEYEVTPLAPGDVGYVGIPGVTATSAEVTDPETGETATEVTWSIGGAEFEDGNREQFVDLFCKLCDEFAPIISLMLKGDNVSLFADAITILGYESYADSIGMLFEMLGVTGVMTQAQYKAYCNANGDAEAFNFLTNQLFDWLDDLLSGNTVKKVIDLMPEFTYFIQSNGISTVLHNCLMPLLVVLDDVRPIVDIDINQILTVLVSDLLNSGEVDITKVLDIISGDYAGETDPDYVEYPIDLGTLTFDNIIKLVDIYFGTNFYDSQLIQTGLNGLCAGKTAYTSVTGKPAYTTSVDTADSLTILITAIIEGMQYETASGKTNGDIVCAFIDEQTETTTATDMYNAILGIFEDVVTDLDDIKWACMYDDYDYTNLVNLTLPEHSIVYTQYTNNWNGATAEYVDGVLSDLIDEILNSTSGSDLGTVLSAAINDGLYNDDILNTLIEAIVKALVNLDDTLLGLIDTVIDTDIESWFDYCTITRDVDGNVTDVECTKAWNVTDKASFIAAFEEALDPTHSLISWLFFGTDYKFFTGTEKNDDGSFKYNDVITINGGEGYAYGLVPVLEALGCTMGYANDSGIKPQSAYDNGDGTYDVSTAIDDVLNALFGKLDEVGAAPIDTILAMLPNLVYFINADGVKVSVNNLLDPIYVLLGKLSPLVGEVNLDEALGFPLSDITWPTIFGILEDNLGLKIPEKCQELITTFYIGDITYFTSANGRGSFYMSYDDEETRKDMVTIVLSLAVDVIGYEANADKFTEWFGSDIYKTIKNILDMAEAKAMQNFSWYYTEFANTDKTFSAVDTSGKYVNTYNEYWTKDRAQYVADNLQAFIDNILCLLGLEINGMSFDSINDLVADLVDTNIYTQSNADALVKAVKDATAKITGLDPYGEYISNALKTATGLDLHAWDNMTVTVTDGDRQSFTDALCQILVPALPLLNILLNNEDVSFFINIDGEDMITIPGSEGYAYGIIPLLEALDCDGILTADEYKSAIAADPNAAVTAIVNPVFDKLEDIKADPTNEIINILPGVIYFINSNGLDTCVKNILNSADTVIAALEPVLGETNCEKLFNIEIVSEINFDYLLNLALDKINESTGYDLTPFAADAISELTVGKVVTYPSKNGETYYTMEYASKLDKADMITILLRIGIDFITMDENIAKIEGLLQQYIPNEDNYNYVCSMIENLAKYAKQDPGMGQSLYVLFYIFYGLNNAAEVTDDWYHDVNNSWQFILKMLDDSSEPMLNGFSSSLKGVLNKYFGGIFDDKGVASSGFITFFKNLSAFFQKIIDFFKGLFK